MLPPPKKNDAVVIALLRRATCPRIFVHLAAACMAGIIVDQPTFPQKMQCLPYNLIMNMRNATCVRKQT